MTGVESVVDKIDKEDDIWEGVVVLMSEVPFSVVIASSLTWKTDSDDVDVNGRTVEAEYGNLPFIQVKQHRFSRVKLL